MSSDTSTAELRLALQVELREMQLLMTEMMDVVDGSGLLAQSDLQSIERAARRLDVVGSELYRRPDAVYRVERGPDAGARGPSEGSGEP